jgi:enterochelin esterase-like enzyme
MQTSGVGGATAGGETASATSTMGVASVGGASATAATAATTASVGGAAGTVGTTAGADSTSSVSTVSTSVGGSGGVSGSGGAAAADGGSAGTSSVVDPGTEGDGDYTIGPPYSGLEQQDVPEGTTYQWSMPSSESAIYRGDDATLNNPQSFNRGVRVYIPAQYVDGSAAPLIVVQDGYVGDLEVATNNLVAEGSLPALVLVFVDNGGGDSKGSQRGLEYDTLSDRYSRFITSEVLPAVESNPDILADYPNFHFTTDPEGRGAYGCSSGGAAAFTMGWFTPNEFRRIITYSGTFVDQQDDDAAEESEYPLGAWEYHTSSATGARFPARYGLSFGRRIGRSVACTCWSVGSSMSVMESTQTDK